MAESLALVPVFTGTIQSQSVQLCDARTLHAFMAVLRDFTTWIKGRISKFGFVEGVDYLLTKSGEQLPSGTKYSHDYHLTLDMAKELAMVENNAKGREARRYFIECEKRATAPQRIAIPYAVAPGQTLTEDEAQTLRDMLTNFADSMPKDLRGQIMMQGWSKLKAHFNVAYRQIPRAEFTEAVSIISRHLAQWAPADPKKTALAAPATPVRTMLTFDPQTGQTTMEQMTPAHKTISELAAGLTQGEFSRQEVYAVADAVMRLWLEVGAKTGKFADRTPEVAA